VNEQRRADDGESGSSGAELTTPADEPEPDWADAVRRGRRERARRLREVFARLDDDPIDGAT